MKKRGIWWEIKDFLDECKAPAIAGAIGAVIGTILIRIIL